LGGRDDRERDAAPLGVEVPGLGLGGAGERERHEVGEGLPGTVHPLGDRGGLSREGRHALGGAEDALGIAKEGLLFALVRGAIRGEQGLHLARLESVALDDGIEPRLLLAREAAEGPSTRFARSG